MGSIKEFTKETMLLSTFDERRNKFTKYEENLITGKTKRTLISSDDFYDLPRRKLEDILYNAIYSSYPESSILCVRTSSSSTITYYFDDNSWVSNGEIWNVLKNSMQLKHVFNGSNRDCYSNLKYLLDHNSIKELYVLVF